MEIGDNREGAVHGVAHKEKGLTMADDTSITIAILAVLHQGEEMLSWQDILQNHIPNSGKNVQYIINTINNLQDEGNPKPSATAQWYRKVFGKDAPLLTGIRFSGTLYCEALTISLIHTSHLHMQGELKMFLASHFMPCCAYF